MSHDERTKLANAITTLTCNLEQEAKREIRLGLIEQIEKYELQLLRIDQQMRRELFQKK